MIIKFLPNFDCEVYYKNNMDSLKKALEESPEMWDSWINYNKKYLLVSCLTIVEDDVDNHPSGRVTGRLDLYVNSDILEDLKLLWRSKFVQGRLDDTRCHFIADIKEKKVVEFLSVCM
jgi:hypothetical protein